MKRYVVMFNNNRYFRDGAVFNKYYTTYSKFEVTYDRTTTPTTIIRRERTEEERRIFVEEAKHNTLMSCTTDSIEEARIFDNKASASLAASRGGYSRKDGDFSVLPISITLA